MEGEIFLEMQSLHSAILTSKTEFQLQERKLNSAESTGEAFILLLFCFFSLCCVVLCCVVLCCVVLCWIQLCWIQLCMVWYGIV